MDIAENLNYSFEEQCFLQIARLREELRKEENSNQKKCKYLRSHRLFRQNPFEEINSQRKQYLEKLLCYTLKSLGQHINSNLLANAREANRTLSTPTPVRDLSLDSPISSRPHSRTISPFHIPRSRSASVASDILNPINEVIVVSSDEELDNEDEVIIKTEPVESEQYESGQYESGQYESGQYESGQYESGRFGDVNLQDITSMNNFQDPIQGNSNTLLLVDRQNRSNYLHNSDGVLCLKPKKHIKYNAAGLSRQALILHIIAKVIKLIGTENYITKRELYYLSLDFCRMAKKHQKSQTQTQGSSSILTQNTESQNYSQTRPSSRPDTTRYSTSKLETALDDLCCLVGCSKVHLHILTQSKGIVYGDLKFKLKTGESVDCLAKKDGTSLPTLQFPITEIESDAKFIIVLEKDSILQKILNQEDEMNFVRNYKVILLTAKGYPDGASRAFLSILWSKLKIPILALTDADPHGLEIVCSYKFGNYATAYEALHLAVPQVRWLGLLPTDVMTLALPESKTIPQTQNDIKKISSLLARPYLKNKKAWIHQLNIMRELGRKAELESLDSNGEYLVGTYLPNKLRYASWL